MLLKYGGHVQQGSCMGDWRPSRPPHGCGESWRSWRRSGGRSEGKKPGKAEGLGPRTTLAATQSR